MAKVINVAGYGNVWCPKCGKVQPMEMATMKADDRCDHDAADILCGACKFVVATLHADGRVGVDFKNEKMD